MALPVALGLASAGLSIASGISGNSAITKAATAQYQGNKLFIERDSSVLQNNLAWQANEVNNELGMALTALGLEADKMMAVQTVSTTERNAFGNTAMRQQAAVAMKEALQVDSLAQAAEAKMMDVQTSMWNAKYETEARHAQNMQSYNNSMSQRQSTFSILAGAASAGLSGYSAGVSLDSAMTTLDNAKATQAFLARK
jgi:hypothetical protein